MAGEWLLAIFERMAAERARMAAADAEEGDEAQVRRLLEIDDELDEIEDEEEEG